ncbi:MAG: YraN family protein [Betaproteobacteria bacterium]
MEKTLADSKRRAQQAAQRGRQAEDQACDWLTRQGLVLVERNSRFRGGEIDLVMRDKTSIVFVEVRYRSHMAYGGALASLNPKKQSRIRHAASCYLQRTYGNGHWPSCRFDVILIQAGTLSWIPGAF